jgi:hypothetical protein
MKKEGKKKIGAKKIGKVKVPKGSFAFVKKNGDVMAFKPRRGRK